MTTFIDYQDLPEPVRAPLMTLEIFIGDLDGCETNDGTIDADDVVVAFNAIVAALRVGPMTSTLETKP